MTDSMRDTLEATFKDIEERAEQPEEVEEVKEESPETEDQPEDQPEAPEPEKAEARAVEKAETTQTKSPDKPDKSVKTPEKRPDVSLANPPVTWTAKAKAQWNALPEDIKREVRKREQDALNGISQYKELSQIGERYSKAVQPYQAFLKSRGTSPERAVEDALNLSYSLVNSTPQQRGAILRNIAQQYGADLTAPSPEQDKQSQALAPLVNEINSLKQALAAQRDSEQQRQTSTLQQQVETFAAETDETGALKFPYFEELRERMAARLQSGEAKDLPHAYALAAEQHPEISLLIKSEQAVRKQKQDEERAEKARRNNQVNFQRKPPSSAKGAAPQGTMRETIEATFNRMQSA